MDSNTIEVEIAVPDGIQTVNAKFANEPDLVTFRLRKSDPSSER